MPKNFEAYLAAYAERNELVSNAGELLVSDRLRSALAEAYRAGALSTSALMRQVVEDAAMEGRAIESLYDSSHKLLVSTKAMLSALEDSEL